jgi:predicted MFS family arabinose efflux permease
MTQSQSSILGRYVALFRVKGVASLMVTMVVARIPTGCLPILLVLFINPRYGAAAAGMSLAALTIGTALCAPFLGRLVDRGHGPVTLRLSGAASLLASALLIIAAQAMAPVAVVIAASLLTGALTPPVTGTTRALWSTLVNEDLLPIAYSFEILLIDMLYVSGPLLASAFAVLDMVAAGIGFVAVCLAVGSAILSMLKPVTAYALRGRARPTLSPSFREPFLLRSPAVLFLLLACLMALAFSGWLETLLPLYYGDSGQSLEGGMTIAIWSIGSIAGVLLFVRFQPKRQRISLPSQLVGASLIYLATCAALPLFAGSFLGTCVVLFAIGLTVSPCTNLHFQLGGDLAAQGQSAELFSWLNTATSVGISVGAFLAGITIEHIGYGVSFALPVILVALSLLATAFLSSILKKAEKA